MTSGLLAAVTSCRLAACQSGGGPHEEERRSLSVWKLSASRNPEDKMASIYGYFDAAGATVPAYDPGLEALCPICLAALSTHAPRVTISLMPTAHDRSFFFRAHKRCWENATAEEQSIIESAIIDSEIDSAPE